ncbi:MAG: SRPBCC family protein [Deltaproteobacteria bacterium]|nr:SRPBCC family protein [Deltaproteobacteria bacterium]
MDHIEKRVTLRAPLDRVWRAISDAAQFGVWFGCELDGPFVAGQRITGRIRPTQVDPAIAKHQQPYDGHPIEWLVEAIEPPHRFAFRWHPFAIEPGVDYSAEPMTLVEFTLAEAAGGTQLVIRESGFDRIPAARRTKAFTANDGGWTAQLDLVAKYLAGAAPTA